MRLLNVGCGGQRDQAEHWYNLDTLYGQLKEGTPERNNLNAEPRYFDIDILTQHLPFADEAFDGILLQHVLEHMTCHEAVYALKQCRRVLARGGAVLVSVPDAEYFYNVYPSDTKSEAVNLFGEPIHDEGFEKFFDYALLRFDHKQLLTRESTACLLLSAGFDYVQMRALPSSLSHTHMAVKEMESKLSRRKFSVELVAIK